MRIAHITGLLALLLTLAAPAFAQTPGTKLWSFDTGQMVQSSPLVGTDGTIYCGSDNGTLYALAPEGSVKWTFATGGNIVSTPAQADDGTLYFGSVDRNFYAVGVDGKERWRFKAVGGITASPAVAADGTIYFGTVNSQLYALTPDGKWKWELKTGGNLNSSPAIGTDGTLYVGSFNHQLYAITPAGARKWEYTTGDQINSSPAIGADGAIYFGSFDGRLHCVLPNGTRKWVYSTGAAIRSSPVIANDGTIYVGSDDRKLHAVNPDGSAKWTFTAGYWVRSTPVIGADGVIYFGAYDNKFYAVNPDGSKAWEFLTGYYVSSSPAMSKDGTVYAGSWDKSIYAFKASAGFADDGWPKFRGNALNNGRATTVTASTAVAASQSNAKKTSGKAMALNDSSLGAISLMTNGVGRITPALGGQLLQIGKTYTLRATPGRDHLFAGWTGGVATNSPTIQFVMRPNLQLQANFTPGIDRARPEIDITSPPDKSRLYNPVFAVRGTARDNLGVQRVEYSVNDGPFKNAEGTNEWVVRLPSLPGSNRVRVRSVDAAGNTSSTLTRTLLYPVASPLSLRIEGEGSIQPPLTGRMVELGAAHTLTAVPAAGYRFAGWEGSITTNTPRVSFVMQTNFTLRARFVPLPFQPVVGSYSGLTGDTNQPSPDLTAPFTITVNEAGAFNGTLQMPDTRIVLKGNLDEDGYARTVVPAGQGNLTFDLYFDARSYPEQVRGLLTVGETVVPLLGNRLQAAAKNATPVRSAGNYRLLVTENGAAASATPIVLAVAISPSGDVRVTGRLDAETQMEADSVISRNDAIALHAAIKGNAKQRASGWLHVSGSQITGTLTLLPSQRTFTATGISTGPAR